MLPRATLPFQPRPADATSEIKGRGVGEVVPGLELGDELGGGGEDGEVVDGEDGGVEGWRAGGEGGERDGVVV